MGWKGAREDAVEHLGREKGKPDNPAADVLAVADFALAGVDGDHRHAAIVDQLSGKQARLCGGRTSHSVDVGGERGLGPGTVPLIPIVLLTLPSTLTATLPIDKAISLPLTVGSGATVPTDVDRAQAGMTEPNAAPAPANPARPRKPCRSMVIASNMITP